MATNFITVRAGRLPGVLSDVALNGGRTAADALQAAGLDAEGYELRVNGEPGSPADELEEGDVVLLVKQVKGN